MKKFLNIKKDEGKEDEYMYNGEGGGKVHKCKRKTSHKRKSSHKRKTKHKRQTSHKRKTKHKRQNKT